VFESPVCRMEAWTPSLYCGPWSTRNGIWLLSDNAKKPTVFFLPEGNEDPVGMPEYNFSRVQLAEQG
jgi:hypothetical protein